MPVIDARIPALMAALLAVAMVATLGWQGYLWWQGALLTPPGVNGHTARVVPPVSPPPAIRWAEVPLFGTATSAPPETAVNTENLPPTNLRLSLRGVLATEGDFPGSALIEDDRGNTEVYLVGHELPGNAILRAVHASRVVIDRSGKLENLYFPDDDNRRGLTLSVTQQQREAGLPVRQPAPAASPAAVQRPAAPVGSDQRREEIRQRLDELRQRLRNNSN
ncbi:type II secretion system protein N [Marinobacter sp. X15-166B]|uniref:type II secretion system protein N n=1 Tax=Marinobacter sp. X15-166B TaxID=1897620 RepID=UPI00085C571F|nr:type II secretion system protein N [Marinobacter sp. X15-166B]OEY67543.1 hypothetical protein BG841_14605 [Marinobacter sp. X15-166B]